MPRWNGHLCSNTTRPPRRAYAASRTSGRQVCGHHEYGAGTRKYREVRQHTHPGVEIAYVLEGSIVDLKIGDALPKTINPGESFMVPAYTPHSAKWGPDGVKALAILVLEKDKPPIAFTQ
jgi:mannose-6-phosphate isomerase-like protein (cupin superfamily)